jgi:hypothetical protein
VLPVADLAVRITQLLTIAPEHKRGRPAKAKSAQETA